MYAIRSYYGNCPVHENFSADKLKLLKEKYPEAKVLAHPEANKQVLLLADLIGSTSKIIKYAVESKDNQFIIATDRITSYNVCYTKLLRDYEACKKAAKMTGVIS